MREHDVARKVAARQLADARALLRAHNISEEVGLQLILLGARMAGYNEAICTVTGMRFDPQVEPETEEE